MPQFHVIAQVKARAGKEAELAAAFKILAAASLTEPGCRTYVPYSAESGGLFYVYEIYDDREAFQAHLDSPHFKEAGAAFADLVDGTPQIDIVSEV